MFNPLTKGFYVFFRTIIRGAWDAAKRDELAKIASELPGDADIAEVRQTLADAKEEEYNYALPALPPPKSKK